MPLNKRDIETIIASYDFPIDQYSILMGAALVMHGVKECANDIDIGCSAELFEMLSENGYGITMSRSGCQKVAIDNVVTVYKAWMPSKKTIIGGLSVSDLESIVADKKRFNRSKDIDDIILINAYINNKVISND